MLAPLALIRRGPPRLNRSAARSSPERIAYLSHKDGGWERQNPYGLTARATRDGPQYHRQTSAMKRAAITKVDFVTRKGHPFGWSAFPHPRLPRPGKLGGERRLAFADIVAEIERPELVLPGKRIDIDQAAVGAPENSGVGVRQDHTSAGVATHETSRRRPRGGSHRARPYCRCR